ncbi:SUMO ligase siz1 [Orbilia ellipsospora]|uniref:SUMO ligase siz1 n=1 Tax=Orbilia ellipsospora TaxID=2528407 RepID=A0AAV9XI86_9PEZI
MSGDNDPRWEHQRQALQKYVQSKLLVRHLTTILKKLALPVSGLKAAQQARLVDQINTVVESRNDEALQRLKRLIYNPENADQHTSPSPSMNTAPPRPHHLTKPPSFSSPQYVSPGGVYHSPMLSPNPPSMTPASTSSSPTFYPSPFYDVQSNLTTIHGLQAYNSNGTPSRSVLNMTLALTPQTVDDIRSGFRTMLYSAGIEGNTVGPHHVAFPAQIEIRVNGKAVSANLRGLKNKPGTTKPLDLTDLLDKTPGFKNNIMITYALSSKRYLVIVKLVRKYTPEAVLNTIKARPHISKQNVLDRLRKESQDDDIVATSSIMSLKCPASTLRIVTPIRSSACKHHQCYDGLSFLQLQEQAPAWSCPVCSKKIEFEQLAVDKYVEEILKSVPKSVESVMIDPMGNWTVPEKKESSPRIKRDRDSYDDDDDDDDSEDELSILDTAPTSFRSSTNGFNPTLPSINGQNGSTLARPNPFSTPKSLSSEPLAASSSRPNGGNSNKRPAPVHIDLTLSDEEDDEVRARPAKRLQTSATPTPSYTYSKPSNTTPAGPFTLSWANSGYDY